MSWRFPGGVALEDVDDDVVVDVAMGTSASGGGMGASEGAELVEKESLAEGFNDEEVDVDVDVDEDEDEDEDDAVVDDADGPKVVSPSPWFARLRRFLGCVRPDANISSACFLMGSK